MALAKHAMVEAALIRESDGRKDHRALKQRTIKAVQEMYRAHAEDVLRVRLECLLDETAEWKDRLKAAMDIDNRGQGTPVQTTQISIHDKDESVFDADKAAKLDSEQLAQIEKVLLQIAATRGGEMIDVSPNEDSENES